MQITTYYYYRGRNTVMNHNSIELCTCGYSTYSKKWMKTHLLKEHNDNKLFNYVTLEQGVMITN